MPLACWLIKYGLENPLLNSEMDLSVFGSVNLALIELLLLLLLLFFFLTFII